MKGHTQPERVTQPWFLQDLLQGLSATERPGLGRAGDPKTGGRAAARTCIGQSTDSWSSRNTASPGEPKQRPPGARPVPRGGAAGEKL